MTSQFNDAQRETLQAFCNTIVPTVPREFDPDGFWARQASDLGIDQVVEQVLLQLPDPTIVVGVAALLDALASQSFASAPSQLSREQILRNISLTSPMAAAGIRTLTELVIYFNYAMPITEMGQNPNWSRFGYPGPISNPPTVPKVIQPLAPTGDEEQLEADVCIVGSGAGGGVIAGILAQQGIRVVVLEAGDYFNESDFVQLEIPAYQQLYWHSGPTPTADGNVSLQAGTTLGGGTVVNWTNCVRTTSWVREEWAQTFGLEGLDTAEFDEHLDAILKRLGANTDCSDLNGPQQLLKVGSEKLGWSYHMANRNADPATYTPESAGYMGFGDQSGSKQSTTKTFLKDAYEHGAAIVVRCRVNRILVQDGQARGVEGLYTSPTGQQTRVIVQAPQVVVACGSLESPALLLRSGIGGPVVGQNLHLHPCVAVSGVYQNDLQAWWGPPQAIIGDEFANVEQGYGFLIEHVQYTPGTMARNVNWLSGEQHKELLAEVPNTSILIAVTRDHGSGQVLLDAKGEAMPLYAVKDKLDQRNLFLGMEKMIRLHEAAGARKIIVAAVNLLHWRVGDDLEAFIHTAQSYPLQAGGIGLYSAHQMGTCPMGTDPATSVANTQGELHDIAGVWIGDGSAFPTASGTNPMLTIMALAHRTAQAIAEEHKRGVQAGDWSMARQETLLRLEQMPEELRAEAVSQSRVSSSTVREELYIDGQWVKPAGSGRIDVLDSTTEESIGSVPEGTPEDIERAVTAARRAFDSWSQLPLQERTDACRRIAHGLAARTEEIATLIAREMGMPIMQSVGIQVGLPTITFAAIPEIAQEIPWEEQIGNSLVVREAVGVVGCITPWNYPLHQIAAKVAPALAAGCTVVLKPSEVAPLNSFILAEIIDEAGLPPGVFNLVSGTGPVVGEALVSHPEVDMISFTGSTRAGKRISELASATVKRVALELGGKSPNILLDDANFMQAIITGLTQCYLNAGQTCSALTRMLVPQDRLAEVEAVMAMAVSQIVLGSPFDPKTQIGPLVSETQRERVLGYIHRGLDEGAKLIAGGSERPAGLEKGYFVQPTVFSEVTPEMIIAQEEIFGPVLVLMPYKDEEDAIRIANSTQYGLAGGVWSEDPERARRVARRLRTGRVDINGATFNPLAPFGGYKQSGHGRELGRYGLEEFLVAKAIQL